MCKVESTHISGSIRTSRTHRLIANHVIISLGSNDHKYVKTEAELRVIRKLTEATRVYWVMPSDKFPEAQSAVWHVANETQRYYSQNGSNAEPIMYIHHGQDIKN
jgi:hypothetical protein